MRPLGVLVTGDPVPRVEERRGPFVALIRAVLGDAWPGPVVTFDARRGELPEPQELGALVITGSPESVASRAPWILAAERALRGVVDAGVPTLGICFGHQLLGQALGGEVALNPRGREMGSVPLTLLESDALLGAAAGPYLTNMSHRDSVTRLPPGARVLARTELEPHAAVRFGERAWGVQFHPEFDGEVMRGYIEARAAALAADGIDPESLAALDAPEAARVVTAFAKLAQDSR
ncbi:MAG TPA: glutamine amidotransferase [Polyangiaceae bacterium]|nr:glutamine amidotransferase [Polyangiaceae bacterium]